MPITTEHQQLAINATGNAAKIFATPRPKLIASRSERSWPSSSTGAG